MKYNAFENKQWNPVNGNWNGNEIKTLNVIKDTNIKLFGAWFINKNLITCVDKIILH